MKEYIHIVFMNVHLYLLLKEDIIPSNCSIYLLYSFLLRNKRKGVFYIITALTHLLVYRGTLKR